MSRKDQLDETSEPRGRRGFLKRTALGMGAAAMAGSARAGSLIGHPMQPENRRAVVDGPQDPFAAPPMDEVKIGFVGVGGMGTVHVRNLLQVPGAKMVAICDIREEHALRAQKLTTEAGQPKPTLYTRGEFDFVRMCEEEDLDLVYTATPWKYHVPICLEAMKNGKHAATEVPAAYTLDGCWDLVNAAEKYQKHCVMMENCNYDRPELMAYNMVRKGVLGEVLHGECGYLHDLRGIKFSDNGEGLWRREHSKFRNGNLYPTHGVGPMAQCMDINRGDYFDYIVSMSSPSRGLQEFAKNNFPADSPMRAEKYVLGDVNVSLIKTVHGKTMYVNHDTNLPRPYSRINIVQGTKGLFSGYPNRVYIEGVSESHKWDSWEKYFDEYDHPMWKQELKEEHKYGHGGMDYMEDARLIKCLLEGKPTDMNVYDAAAISAVCALSELSVANGSVPIKFPDFTGGRWKDWKPLGIVTL
ncbi:MAG: Gfo/Idh/MocA family oxidoreductase [Rhodothermales bacterium]|nr:Gfo/Idh/MocA family oxidoreductase [Rhodothermales bacterium]